MHANLLMLSHSILLQCSLSASFVAVAHQHLALQHAWFTAVEELLAVHRDSKLYVPVGHTMPESTEGKAWSHRQNLNTTLISDVSVTHAIYDEYMRGCQDIAFLIKLIGALRYTETECVCRRNSSRIV